MLAPLRSFRTRRILPTGWLGASAAPLAPILLSGAMTGPEGPAFERSYDNDSKDEQGR